MGFQPVYQYPIRTSSVCGQANKLHFQLKHLCRQKKLTKSKNHQNPNGAHTARVFSTNSQTVRSYLVDGSKSWNTKCTFPGRTFVWNIATVDKWNLQNTRGHYMTPNKNNTPLKGKGNVVKIYDICGVLSQSYTLLRCKPFKMTIHF